MPKIHIDLPDGQYNKIKKEAGAALMPVSVYLRAVICGVIERDNQITIGLKPKKAVGRPKDMPVVIDEAAWRAKEEANKGKHYLEERFNEAKGETELWVYHTRLCAWNWVAEEYYYDNILEYNEPSN
jgi:hypothetical protein